MPLATTVLGGDFVTVVLPDNVASGDRSSALTGRSFTVVGVNDEMPAPSQDGLQADVGRLDDVIRLTGLFRSSDDPMWSRLRTVLAERGYESQQVILADFFPDDLNVEFGVVVTNRREAFEFDFHYGKGDISHQIAEGRITDWRDRTNWWQDTPSRTSIEAALLALDDDI